MTGLFSKQTTPSNLIASKARRRACACGTGDVASSRSSWLAKKVGGVQSLSATWSRQSVSDAVAMRGDLPWRNGCGFRRNLVGPAVGTPYGSYPVAAFAQGSDAAGDRRPGNAEGGCK